MRTGPLRPSPRERACSQAIPSFVCFFFEGNSHEGKNRQQGIAAQTLSHKKHDFVLYIAPFVLPKRNKSDADDGMQLHLAIASPFNCRLTVELGVSLQICPSQYQDPFE